MENYSQEFFKSQESGSSRSAQVVVPELIKLFKPKSVIDIGCGIGTWLAVFAQNGIKDYLGVDGDYVSPSQLLIPNDKFLPQDLEKPLSLDRKFDLAISFEVGEHLEKEKAPQFVKSIVNLAPVVVFSAAIPGQSGHKHKNEQSPEFWANLFRQNNYVPIDYLRKRLWENQEIEWWYRQNMIVYIDKKVLGKYPQLSPEATDKIPALVHPNLYASVNFAVGRGQFMVYVYKFMKYLFGSPQSNY